MSTKTKLLDLNEVADIVVKLAMEKFEKAMKTVDNPPLTWGELKAMEGKPVWVEEPYSFCDEWHGYWEVISSFFNDDYADEPDSVVYMTNEEIRHKNDLGKTWQAYREER